MQSFGHKRKNKGFTLVEMLVVILIIFILIGIALAVGMQVQANSQIQLTKMELRNLQSALDWYHHKTGVYPANMEDFLAAYQRMHAYQITGSSWQIHSNVLSQLPAQNVVTSTFAAPNGSSNMTGVCEVLDGFGDPIQYCPPPTPANSTGGTALWPVNSGSFTIFTTPVSAVFVLTNGTVNGSSYTLPAASSNGHGAFFYSLGTQYNTSGTYSAQLTTSDYMYSYAP